MQIMRRLVAGYPVPLVVPIAARPCPGQPSCLRRDSAEARKATTDVLITLSVGARQLSAFPCARTEHARRARLVQPAREHPGARGAYLLVDAPLFSAGAAAGGIDGCPRPIGRDSHGSSPYPVRRWPSARLWS